jgi:hypothetical protein
MSSKKLAPKAQPKKSPMLARVEAMVKQGRQDALDSHLAKLVNDRENLLVALANLDREIEEFLLDHDKAA